MLAKVTASHRGNVKSRCAWIGSLCLLLIIPIKAVRWTHGSQATSLLVGIAPSLLGPMGLLFLVLSGSGRLSRLNLRQLTVLVGVIALSLEFAQLLPRPGILSRVHYTFDWLDVISSVFSLGVGYVLARFIAREKPETH